MIIMVIVMVLITMMIMLVLDKAPADSGPHPTHGDIRVKPCWASLPVFHQPGIDNKFSFFFFRLEWKFSKKKLN